MLYIGNCLNILPSLTSSSVDMIFADPPYFLSNGGNTIRSGKITSVDKGEWDNPKNYSDVKSFTRKWISLCAGLLKPEGTIWISTTHHNIANLFNALENAHLHFINAIIWHKEDPPRLIYKTKFKFSYETILWFGKSSKHYFDYQKMYDIDNKEMEDVWTLPAVSQKEKAFGYHPTQKPEKLLERIISASTKEQDMVLDPFMGSGTTGAVAKRMNRKFIGIEQDEKYFSIATNRLRI